MKDLLDDELNNEIISLLFVSSLSPDERLFWFDRLHKLSKEDRATLRDFLEADAKVLAKDAERSAKRFIRVLEEGI